MLIPLWRAKSASAMHVMCSWRVLCQTFRPVVCAIDHTGRAEQTMCNSVSCAGRIYQTPSQLAELVGGVDSLVWVTTDLRRNMNGCLCSIELEPTLERAGFR